MGKRLPSGLGKNMRSYPLKQSFLEMCSAWVKNVEFSGMELLLKTFVNCLDQLLSCVAASRVLLKNSF